MLTKDSAKGIAPRKCIVTRVVLYEVKLKVHLTIQAGYPHNITS